MDSVEEIQEFRFEKAYLIMVCEKYDKEKCARITWK